MNLSQCRRPQFDSSVGNIPWRRERLPTPVFWLGEFHGVAKSQTQLSNFHFIFCDWLIHLCILKIYPTQDKSSRNVFFRNQQSGLCRWFNGKESALRCKGHQFHPWSRKIPHAEEQLSPCATTAEPAFCNKRSPCNEKPTRHTRQQPSAHHKQGKPSSRNKGPAQPKIHLERKKNINQILNTQTGLS